MESLTSETPATFIKTDSRIDNSYIKSSDTLSTINAIILVLVAVFCCFMSFSFTLSGTQVWMPVLFVSGLVLSFVAFLVWYNTRPRYSLMSNVVPVFTTILLVGLLALFNVALVEGSWTVPEPSENTVLYTAVALAFALLAAYWMNTELRADLIRFNSGAFAAFVFFCVFFSAGMIYVGSLLDRAVKKWVKQGRIGAGAHPFVYWSLAGAIMMGLLLIDEITNALINRAMGFGMESLSQRAASSELANATWRSKQMVVAVYSVLLFLPLGLVFWVKDGLVHAPEAPPQAFVAPMTTLALLFPLLAAVGLGLHEMRRFYPSAYRLIEALIGGLLFFVVATQFVPWENAQVLTVLALCAFTYSVLSIFSRQPSVIAVAIPAAALAVAVVTSDHALLFTLAAASVTAVWTVYSYKNSESVGAPLALTGFFAGFALECLYGLKETDKNIGLQVAIIAPIMSFAIALARELGVMGKRPVLLTFVAGLLGAFIRMTLHEELVPYFKDKQENMKQALWLG